MCGGGFLQRVVKNEVQKEVITAQCPADLAAALEVDEKLLVHELWDAGVSGAIAIGPAGCAAHLFELWLGCFGHGGVSGSWVVVVVWEEPNQLDQKRQLMTCTQPSRPFLVPAPGQDPS